MNMEQEPNGGEHIIDSILKQITEEFLNEKNFPKEKIEKRIERLERESLNEQKGGYEKAIREGFLTEEEVKKMIKEALMIQGNKRCAKCKKILGEKIGIATTTDGLCQNCVNKQYGKGFVSYD